MWRDHIQERLLADAQEALPGRSRSMTMVSTAPSATTMTTAPQEAPPSAQAGAVADHREDSAESRETATASVSGTRA